MSRKTKIDWCDSTWNPVTGCLHGCAYCYAKRIATRFGDHQMPIFTDLPILHEPVRDGAGVIRPYPFDFEPTFHEYKLRDLNKWKMPRTIFVGSMTDLFGCWVPDEWIQAVLNACRENPQHRYLFLTKNPARYDALEDAGIITEKDQNFYLGSTVENVMKDMLHYSRTMHTFMSCEPMNAPWPPAGEPNPKYQGRWPEWVIFGAETGNRKGMIIPEKEWIDNAVQMCRNIGAKVFMKESLRGIMGADFIQEYPWKVKE